MAYTRGGGDNFTRHPAYPSGREEEELFPDYDLDASVDPRSPRPRPDLNGGVWPHHDPHPHPYGAGQASGGHHRQYYEEPHHHDPDHYYSGRRGSGEFDNPGFSMDATPPPSSARHQRTLSEGPGPELQDLGPVPVHRPVGGALNLSFSMGDTASPQVYRAARRRYTRNKSKWGRRRKGEEDGEEEEEGGTLRPEERQRALDFLATIRVRRRQRKSLRRQGSERSDGGEDRRGDWDRGEEGEEEYEEMVGMPSAHVLDKSKTLTERLLELKGNNEEVARSLRERYAEFDPSLVASAAWKGWENKKKQLSDVWTQLDIWASHFKEIEGRFGNATASYFRFTRWLVLLNFFTFLVSFLVVVVPYIATDDPDRFLPGLDLSDPQPLVNASVLVNHAVNCTATYVTNIDNFTQQESVPDQVLDFFVGTGWMEQTTMFYGHYHNRTFPGGYNYNMGLAYILAIGLTFLVSFLLILVNASSSVKQTVMDEEQSTVHYTNSVICGWDYCIMDAKSALNKQCILCQEFKADLLEQSKRLQRENRTYRDKVKLVLVRIVVNFVVVCMLGGCIYAIYLTTNSLLDLREKTTDQVLLLIIQLLPSLTITVINFIIPEIFNILVSFEDYRPAFELKFTLLRTVFLRLSSLGVLTFTLYYTLLWPNDKGQFVCGEEGGTTGKSCCGNFLWEGQKREENGSVVEPEDIVSSTVQCWETYVGQQFYKLALVDFAANVVITFFVEFPRKFIYDRFKGRVSLLEKYGQQEFDIPRNVLDIVYSQTLSWLGSFFSPLLPAITLIKVFFIFYIKKLTLMKNFAPPQNVYKVSRSNSFFNLILLISFVIVAVIIGYMLGNIHPSKSCGPYRLYSIPDYVTWTALTDVIAGWPNWASTLFFFFGTTAFFVPCFILLCLLMYYYWAVGQGYKRRDEILKEQLRLEGKDKHFLLARVNDIIKQGNLKGVTSSRRS